MNADTYNDSEYKVFAPVAENEPVPFADPRRRKAKPRDARHQQRSNNRILNFIAELRRRQVCRTITMYSVALWVICQIVDVIAPQLGLPPWTTKFVIVLGLVGFPIALILSWLFDITRDGVVTDVNNCAAVSVARNIESRKVFDQAIDCSLVLVALVISVQLATGILTNDAHSAPAEVRKLAVLPFRIAAGDGAEHVAQGLLSELQHEIASTTGLIVIAPREQFLGTDCLSLAGAVSVSASTIRVTATLIDNETGEITWSRVFEISVTDPVLAPAAIAKNIVAALPRSLQLSSIAEYDHAT
jgi:TolB-like protein